MTALEEEVDAEAEADTLDPYDPDPYDLEDEIFTGLGCRTLAVEIGTQGRARFLIAFNGQEPRWYRAVTWSSEL